jgi:hypothetical protein
LGLNGAPAPRLQPPGPPVPRSSGPADAGSITRNVDGSGHPGLPRAPRAPDAVRVALELLYTGAGQAADLECRA